MGKVTMKPPAVPRRPEELGLVPECGRAQNHSRQRVPPVAA
jgi:hypothetical protein